MSWPPSVNRSILRLIGIVAQTGFTIFLFVNIFSRLDLVETEERLIRAIPSWLVVSFGLLLLQQFIAAGRWRMIGKILSIPRFQLPLYWQWYGVGLICSQTLPLSVGGDIVRIYALAKRDKIGRAFRSVLVDRAIGLNALAIFVLVGFFDMQKIVAGGSVMVVPMAMALTGIVLTALITMLSAKISGSNGNKLLDSLGLLGRDIKTVITGPCSSFIIANSLLIHGLAIAAFFTIAQAIANVQIGLLDWIIIVSSVLLVTVVPVSIGGWGLREGASVVGFGLVGTAPETAIGMSILFGILTLISGLMLTVTGLVFSFVTRYRRAT